VGLKTHFNEWKFYWRPDYDYKLSESAFLKRADKHYFDRIYKTFPKRKERIEFFISCFLKNKRLWIGDMFDESLLDNHQSRMQKRGALIYTFRNDVENILDFMADNSMTFKKILLSDGQKPLIIKFRHQINGGVSDETFALFDKFFGFTKQVTPDPLWEEERMRFHKYNHLLEIERIDQVKPILKQLVAQSSVSAHGQ
jgi:hypothetical protein